VQWNGSLDEGGFPHRSHHRHDDPHSHPVHPVRCCRCLAPVPRGHALIHEGRVYCSRRHRDLGPPA
jgi:hypothetical protein